MSDLRGWDDGSRRMRSLLEMILDYGRWIADLVSLLSSFDEISKGQFEKQPDGSFRDADLRLASSALAGLKHTLPGIDGLGLKLSHMYAVRLVEIWEKPNGIGRVIEQCMIHVLSGRIKDELRGTFFFFVTTDRADKYNAPLKGWGDVIDRFPEAQMDIEEMNKCLALSRYAATVFHSVNIIERGLIALGPFVGVNDPKSGWTAVTGALDRIVNKTKFPDLEERHKSNFGFLEQLYGTTAALKNAWRNKISHAQGRLVVLNPDFTEEIVDEIVYATRAFMRRLATEMPT